MNRMIFSLLLILFVVSNTSAQENLIKTIVPEFIVNKNIDENNYSFHYLPNISGNKRNQFVIAWVDERNGRNIYCQLYSNNKKVSNNIKIIENNSDYSIAPTSLIYDDGYFSIFWFKQNSINSITGSIYVQKYDSNGTAIGGNVCLIDSVIHSPYWLPINLISNSNREFAINWISVNKNEQSYKINIQKFNANLEIISKKNEIISDTNLYNTSKFCFNEDNNILLAQTQSKGMILSLFDDNANIIFTKKINTDVINESLYNVRSPLILDVECIKKNKYGLIWNRLNNATLSEEVYILYFDKYCFNIDSVIQLNANINLTYDENCQVKIKENNDIYIFTTENYNNDEDPDPFYFCAQKFDSTGLLKSKQITDDYLSRGIKGWRENFKFIVGDTNNIIAVWNEGVFNKYYNIYIQQFTDNTNIEYPISLVNDDIIYAEQKNPNFTVDDASCMTIAWEDNRRGNNDIFMQKIDSSGHFMETNSRVNDDVIKSSSNYISVATIENGNYIIA